MNGDKYVDVRKSGNGKEWLITLRNTYGREVLTAGCTKKKDAAALAQAFGAMAWLVTA